MLLLASALAAWLGFALLALGQARHAEAAARAAPRPRPVAAAALLALGLALAERRGAGASACSSLPRWSPSPPSPWWRRSLGARAG